MKSPPVCLACGGYNAEARYPTCGAPSVDARWWRVALNNRWQLFKDTAFLTFVAIGLYAGVFALAAWAHLCGSHWGVLAPKGVVAGVVTTVFGRAVGGSVRYFEIVRTARPAGVTSADLEAAGAERVLACAVRRSTRRKGCRCGRPSRPRVDRRGEAARGDDACRRAAL